MQIAEINFLNIEKNKECIKIVNKTIKECFSAENLEDKNLYINVVLTEPKTIKDMNNKYRNINKETDVLSFPMFEKDELKNRNILFEDVLGDIVISIDRVKEQAIEYGHTFERELVYMIVHGFYHLMGYDHINEDDRIKMRQKEKEILKKLNI